MRCEICDYDTVTPSIYHEGLHTVSTDLTVRYVPKYKKTLCSECETMLISNGHIYKNEEKIRGIKTK